MHTWPNGNLLQIWAGRLERAGFSTELTDVRAATRATEPDVRGIAFAWLGIHDDRGGLADIRQGFQDAYPPARVEAVRAAAMLGDPGARDHLRALLTVDWPETAINAAAYLADLGDSTGYAVLAQAATSPVDALRLQAVLLVRAWLPFDHQGAIDVVGVLRHAALEDASPLVRREAVYQVAALGPALATPILTQALQDLDPTVAKAARLRVDAEVR
jgi:HEAT repeat protein